LPECIRISTTSTAEIATWVIEKTSSTPLSLATAPKGGGA